MEKGQIKLYYHKTYGGAEYLCSECISGTNEGSLNSKYIVRIDGDIKKDTELFIKEDAEKPDYKKAYECLMECWDSFDDTQKAILDKELKECGLY